MTPVELTNFVLAAAGVAGVVLTYFASRRKDQRDAAQDRLGVARALKEREDLQDEGQIALYAQTNKALAVENQRLRDVNTRYEATLVRVSAEIEVLRVELRGAYQRIDKLEHPQS